MCECEFSCREEREREKCPMSVTYAACIHQIYDSLGQHPVLTSLKSIKIIIISSFLCKIKQCMLAGWLAGWQADSFMHTHRTWDTFHRMRITNMYTKLYARLNEEKKKKEKKEEEKLALGVSIFCLSWVQQLFQDIKF